MCFGVLAGTSTCLERIDRRRKGLQQQQMAGSPGPSRVDSAGGTRGAQGSLREDQEPERAEHRQPQEGQQGH